MTKRILCFYFTTHAKKHLSISLCSGTIERNPEKNVNLKKVIKKLHFDVY